MSLEQLRRQIRFILPRGHGAAARRLAATAGFVIPAVFLPFSSCIPLFFRRLCTHASDARGFSLSSVMTYRLGEVLLGKGKVTAIHFWPFGMRHHIILYIDKSTEYNVQKTWRRARGVAIYGRFRANEPRDADAQGHHHPKIPLVLVIVHQRQFGEFRRRQPTLSLKLVAPFIFLFSTASCHH